MVAFAALFLRLSLLQFSVFTSELSKFTSTTLLLFYSFWRLYTIDELGQQHFEIFIRAQCLQKMNKKLGYSVLRQILFCSSAALQQQRLART